MTKGKKSNVQPSSDNLQSQSLSIRSAHVILNHILIILVFSIVLLFFPGLPFTECMHLYLGGLAWSIAIVFMFLVTGELLSELNLPGGLKVNLDNLRELLGSQYLLRTPWILATSTIYLLLILTALSLGSYKTSPWSIDEPPVLLEQFSVIPSPGSRAVSLQPVESTEIHRGNFSYISAVISPPTAECQWSSLNGSTLQTPNQCSTFYSPPLGVDFDLLDVKLTSACRTKQSIYHLQVLVLP